jgi:uncharacterized membrane protein HdeD (DUF308 family)
MENKLKSYRATLAINGVVALLFGVLALFVPNETIRVVAIYFGVLLMVGGIIGVVVSIQNMRKDRPYVSALINSLVSLVIGIFVVFNTQQSLIIFAIIIGIWALIIGAMQLYIALKMVRPGTSQRLMVINSVVTLVFGLLLFFNPFESIIAFVYVIGVMAFIFGAIMLFFAVSISTADTHDESLP